MPHVDFSRAFRYLSVGAISKVSDILFFSVVFMVTGSILGSNLISTLGALAMNYSLHSRFTFKLKNSNKKSASLKYAYVNVVFFILDTSIITILSSWREISEEDSKVLSSIFLMPLGYLLSKNFVFRNQLNVEENS